MVALSKQCLSPNLELTNLARLVGQQPLTLPSQLGLLCLLLHLAFYVSAWDSNSGPQACWTGTFLTEPPPQLCFFIIFVIKYEHGWIRANPAVPLGEGFQSSHDSQGHLRVFQATPTYQLVQDHYNMLRAGMAFPEMTQRFPKPGLCSQGHCLCLPSCNSPGSLFPFLCGTPGKDFTGLPVLIILYALASLESYKF